MTDSWLPMRYRDFYDVPRAIVVEWKGDDYFFDCLYDDEAGDYESEYTVYRLPGEVAHGLDIMSWTDLGHRGERIGRVPVSALAFDPTRRESLNATVFRNLKVA